MGPDFSHTSLDILRPRAILDGHDVRETRLILIRVALICVFCSGRLAWLFCLGRYCLTTTAH